MDEIPIRIPAPAVLAIDPRPFGYLAPEDAAYRRLMRHGSVVGYRNSEARKRLEQQPEHPCYAAPRGRN